MKGGATSQRALRIATGIALALVALRASAGDFETPPVLGLDTAAPAPLRKGDGFAVDDAVPTDGLTTLFSLRSDVGDFEVHGVETLALREGELPALRELAKSSKTEVFGRALADAVARPVAAAAQMVKSPVETAKGLPSGLGRFFERVGSGAERLYDAASDPSKSGSERAQVVAAKGGQLTQDALGYEQELRKLAKRLGVDPYTTNAVLAERLAEFARVAFYGRVGVNTLIAVAVPASLAISGTSATRDLVYDTPRGDLVVRNEALLRGMGVDDAGLRALQAASGFTLSLQTELVEQLGRLDGVKGRAAVVALAATAATTDQAFFVVRGTRMLALQHAVEPLAELQAKGTLYARTRGGALIVPAAVDYVSWTERIGHFAERPDLAAAERRAVVTGRVSPRARSGFASLGWKVVENGPDGSH